MGIKIKLGVAAQESAAHYHQLAKKTKKRMGGLDAAIAETKKKISAAEKKEAGKKKAVVRVVRKKEWYESFGWSFTNSGKLIIIGKNAKQNDVVFARHMEEGDLFFHAEIRGGAATVLKGGVGAGEDEKEFAAILSVCFSKAWVKGFSQADTYYVEKGQLGKHAAGGFVGAGGFAISGKRVWYKNTPLRLRVGVDKEGRIAVGAESAEWIGKGVIVVPGKKGKGETAREIAKILGVNESEVIHVLPSGSFGIIRGDDGGGV